MSAMNILHHIEKGSRGLYSGAFGYLGIDGSANLAMVTSVALTRKPLDFAKVKALYATRLAPFPRFRQRVVERGLPLPVPHWEDMPGFDIGQHLHHGRGKGCF